jgi:hypothetical protein
MEMGETLQSAGAASRGGASPRAGGHFKWYDYAVGGALALFCFIAFLHRHDLWHTASSSVALLDGHILDFYSYNAAQPGISADEYMLPIYVIFAVWSLPLKLLGLTPVGPDASTITMMYYKLLPLLFYLGCAILVYRIMLLLWSNRRAAYFTAVLFFTMPVAFFSAVVMGGYDSLQLFFVLLGMYYFIRDGRKSDIWWAAVWFGVSFTMKFMSLFIFIPLLLYRHKGFKKLAGLFIVSLLPLAAATLPFLRSQAFSGNALGNDYLGRLVAAKLTISQWETALFFFAWFMLCAYCYFKQYDPEDKRKLLYAPMAAMSLFFMLVAWHPQWMVLLIPFLVMTTVFNRKRGVFHLLDLLLTLAYVGLVVNIWNGLLDETMMSHGLLAFLANPTAGYTMQSLYKNFTPIYSAVISAVLAINIIYKNPWRFQEMNSALLEPERADLITARLKYALGVLCFALPAVLCFLA